jgi:hypothetical protein
MESQGSSRDRHEEFSSTEEMSSLRPSLEAAYRSSSEDEDDLEESDPLNAPITQPRSRQASGRLVSLIQRGMKGKSRSSSGKTPAFDQVRRSFWNRRKCLSISLVLLGALVMIFIGIGVWILKSSAKNGQSPPWYPSRKRALVISSSTANR